MAREKGTFNFSANLEVKKQGPLDARQTMITYAELTQAATWQDENGKMYLFDGLTVPVTNGSEKQYYMLINAAQYNQTASWKRIDAGAADSGVKFIDLSSLSPFSFSHEDILEVIGMLPNELKTELQKSPVIGVCKDISNGSIFGSPISYLNIEEDVIINSRLDVTITKGDYFNISLYDLVTKNIKSILIKFDSASNQYENFIFSEDNEIELLDSSGVARNYVKNYTYRQIAPAKVLNRALYLGDLHALQLNANVTTLYQVFKNILDNDEEFYNSYSSILEEIIEKYNNFLGKNSTTGESTVIYSVIETSGNEYGGIYNPIRVTVQSLGDVLKPDEPIISLRYVLNDKEYVLGFSFNGGYIKKIETSLSENYFLPGDITTLTNGMTGSALQAVVGTYSELKAAIDAKKVILCNIGGTSGSCPISARVVSGFVLLSAIYVDKAANKTTTFGINLIPSTDSWATDSATAGLYKKDLATTDTIPGSEFYRLPGDITTLNSESTAADIKGVYGALTTFKAALTAKKAIMCSVNEMVYYVNAGLSDGTTINVYLNSGAGFIIHTITISSSDYVSIEVLENQFEVAGEVVKNVTAEENKGIEVTGNYENKKVGIKIDTVTKGNVTLSVGANGLKGQFTETEEVYKLPGDILSLPGKSSSSEITSILGSVVNIKNSITNKKVITSLSDNTLVTVMAVDNTTQMTFIVYTGTLLWNIIVKYSENTWSDNEVTGTQTYIADKNKVVNTIQATANKGIEIAGSETNPTVGLKLDTTTPGNVDLAVGANGLKATLSSKAVKSGDKVLKVETDKSISATVSLGYDSETKKLQLKGVNEEVFNELDATPFIKDGMLDSATLEVNPSGQSTGTYIKLVFNTESGKDPIYINVTSLIDVYAQGNGISISGKTIAVKLDAAGNSEGYLKLTAAGLKVEGVNSAIATAIAEAFSWHDA